MALTDWLAWAHGRKHVTIGLEMVLIVETQYLMLLLLLAALESCIETSRMITVPALPTKVPYPAVAELSPYRRHTVTYLRLGPKRKWDVCTYLTLPYHTLPKVSTKKHDFPGRLWLTSAYTSCDL